MRDWKIGNLLSRASQDSLMTQQLVTGVVLGLLWPLSLAAAAYSKPNLVVILLDYMGYGDRSQQESRFSQRITGSGTFFGDCVGSI